MLHFDLLRQRVLPGIYKKSHKEPCSSKKMMSNMFIKDRSLLVIKTGGDTTLTNKVS